jgi:tetratricopeptide (TPR) repeat protein
VRYVLEGSVRKAGERLRITAQLIDAETGGHIWADKFDGTIADVFDLQDKITAGVVAAIEPSVRQAEIERAKRKRPDNLDAYDLYLRALEQAYTFTPAGRTAALSLLDSAIALDPNYAEAHGVAAYCLQQRFLWGGRVSADRMAALRHAEAVAAARTDDATALALAAFALSSLAGKHEPALAMVERALAQNPSSATAHNVSAVIYMILGRHEKSLEHAERSLRLSPFDPLRFIPQSALAAAKLTAGCDEEALAAAHRALEANPVFAPGITVMALCLQRLGRNEEARATVRRLLEIAPDTRISTLSERFLFANGLGYDRTVAEIRAAGLPE